ncbi:hypothetical protein [Sphingobium sp.]|uniref:hypothetical protein n=1 Tax=Sphingobium TaxID=165695 RepID=UPI001A307495|nr:hypothetical protein [Sphingobium sp.]MBJ7378334.1 hypothetical protein [Sphingobium sp.]
MILYALRPNANPSSFRPIGVHTLERTVGDLAGWFGGFLPVTAFAMVAATGDIYYGLWYPVVIAAATAVIGLLFLPETFRRNIDD